MVILFTMKKINEFHHSSIMEKLFPASPVWRLLRLLRNDPAGLSGRQLARDSGLSHPTVHRVLKELTSSGLVQVKRIGNSHVYTVNRAHLLYKRILEPSLDPNKLIVMEIDELFRRLPREIRGRVVSLVLFGSWATGKADWPSDADLLVLVNGEKDKASIQGATLEWLTMEFERNTQIMLSPVVYTVMEYRRKMKQGDPLVKNIHRDGIVVHGKSKMEVIVSGR